MAQKQEELPPPSTPSSFLSGVTFTKPDAPIFSFRDIVFTHAMSLIDDDSNIIRDMFQANSIYTITDTLSTSFEDIEDIEYRINNKQQTLNSAATNRLKILKSFSIPM